MENAKINPINKAATTQTVAHTRSDGTVVAFIIPNGRDSYVMEQTAISQQAEAEADALVNEMRDFYANIAKTNIMRLKYETAATKQLADSVREFQNGNYTSAARLKTVYKESKARQANLEAGGKCLNLMDQIIKKYDTTNESHQKLWKENYRPLAQQVIKSGEIIKNASEIENKLRELYEQFKEKTKRDQLRQWMRVNQIGGEIKRYNKWGLRT